MTHPNSDLNRDSARPARDAHAPEWPPPDVRRFNRWLTVLEVVARLLLPDWVYPRYPAEPTPERRLEFLTWLVIACIVGILVLGAWLAGLIPPGSARQP